MFKPVSDDGGNHNQEPRTRLMLTSVGRVVRVDHDPRGLMVPTEHELKMILYDQTDAGNRTHEREAIDYVALNANRRPRRGTGKYLVENRVPTERDDNDYHRRHAWRQRRGNKLNPCLHRKKPSPRDESGEEEDVTTFLDLFSTSGMATRHPAPRSSLPTSSCREATSGRQTRETEDVDHHDTRATMEISKPLAKIDLYNILARAPPAELGGVASHRSRGAIGINGDPTARSKKASRKNMRKKGSSRSVCKVDERQTRQASRAVDSMPGGVFGGYMARDPLGDDVVMLQTKVQEELRRIKGGPKKEKPAASVDTVRRYGTLFAKRPRSLKGLTKTLVKDCQENEIHTGGNTHADAIFPSATTTSNDAGNQSDCFAQGLHNLRYKRSTVAEESRKSSQEESTHGTTINNEQRARISSATGVRTGVSPGDEKRSSVDGVQRGVPTARPIHNYLGHANTKFRAVCHRESKNRLNVDDPERTVIADVAAVERDPSPRIVEALGRDNQHAIIVQGSSTLRGKGFENTKGTAARAEEQGMPPQRSPDGDVELKSTKSEYGEESFELADDTQDSDVGNSAAVSSSTLPEDLVASTVVGVEKSGLGNHNDDGDGHDPGICEGGRFEPASLRCAVVAEEEPSREIAAAAAAALRIEACWRGYLGKRAAKCALRSVLLHVLRNIGGGKMSKVVSLADVEREDRRGLNRALCVATQPRHQLPPKTHILESILFVESLQRRRTSSVEARKRRWVDERRRRRRRTRTNPGVTTYMPPPGCFHGP